MEHFWLQKALGPEICHLFPFIHNITVYGTTSRLLGVGKGATQKKLRIDCNFKKQAKVFYGEVTKDEIISAGVEVLTCLYGANLREAGYTLLQAILRRSSSKDFLCVGAYTTSDCSNS